MDPTQSRMERLPVETQQAIMLALPDAESLKSLALSCRSLFGAFKDAELLVTRQVVLNEIASGVLPEAVAVLEASFTTTWDRSSVQGFMSRHFDARITPSRNWTLSDALSVTKIQSHISYFAEDFFLKSSSMQSFGSHVLPLSENERLRIDRAFYRFEIYCNLFRDFKNPLFALSEQRVVFFSRFSPWENEQLACVHEYLLRVVSPVYNDLAEHDILWSEFDVDYADDMDHPEYVEPLLARGLSFLHSVALAQSYNERYKLLTPGYPVVSTRSLYDALIECNESNDEIFLEDYTADDESAHIKPPFFDDPDSARVVRGDGHITRKDAAISSTPNIEGI
ncbi:hypothetical protein LSUE1_G006855 [Lachnellula suecica]|uniref:F-box domain-containing protein n=1 Tax=Lachnellula suecica TaxID=602035 RepID=A0A8T9C2B5_9HELO|nr:hypothetical protein LSUE1_G006855 [Lachnellula suecica]